MPNGRSPRQIAFSIALILGLCACVAMVIVALAKIIVYFFQ